MQPAAPIEDKGDHVLLRVRVQPRASRESLSRGSDGGYRIALQAPPVEGAANKALCRFLAKQLGVSQGSISVARGTKSRDKTVRLEGVSSTMLREKLGG